jgi:hypothetical protein
MIFAPRLAPAANCLKAACDRRQMARFAMNVATIRLIVIEIVNASMG